MLGSKENVKVRYVALMGLGSVGQCNLNVNYSYENLNMKFYISVLSFCGWSIRQQLYLKE